MSSRLSFCEGNYGCTVQHPNDQNDIACIIDIHAKKTDDPMEQIELLVSRFPGPFRIYVNTKLEKMLMEFLVEKEFQSFGISVWTMGYPGIGGDE